MQVRDVMVPVVGSIAPEASLREAMEKLKALDIDPLPVVSQGKLAGALYEQDVEEHARAAGLATASATVGEVMRAHPACCLDDQTVEYATEQMEDGASSNSSHRVPVVDRQGVLVGLVSLDDLHRHDGNTQVEGAAAGAVESVDQLVTWDADKVDYMSDESFPASDPLPPPTTLD